jgi:hypothetical protein
MYIESGSKRKMIAGLGGIDAGYPDTLRRLHVLSLQDGQHIN